jgi:hypothetical protein
MYFKLLSFKNELTKMVEVPVSKHDVAYIEDFVKLLQVDDGMPPPLPKTALVEPLDRRRSNEEISHEHRRFNGAERSRGRSRRSHDRHHEEEWQEKCRFFNTKDGCRRGSDCKFLHKF